MYVYTNNAQVVHTEADDLLNWIFILFNSVAMFYA